jgi:hypothetical protein
MEKSMGTPFLSLQDLGGAKIIAGESFFQMKPYKPCQNHPDEESLSCCHYCRGDFCSRCLIAGPEYYHCRKPECLKAFEEGRRKDANVPREPGKLSLEDWVTVGAYPGLANAESAGAWLREHGIESRVVDERPIPYGLPEGEEPEGDVQLQVRAVDSHKAMQIIGFNP